jgi:hypothetical protein
MQFFRQAIIALAALACAFGAMAQTDNAVLNPLY